MSDGKYNWIDKEAESFIIIDETIIQLPSKILETWGATSVWKRDSYVELS